MRTNPRGLVDFRRALFPALVDNPVYQQVSQIQCPILP